MKKTYFAPVATATSIEAESMIASSPLKINSTNLVDSKEDGVQLDGGRRSQWGNLWSK